MPARWPVSGHARLVLPRNTLLAKRPSRLDTMTGRTDIVKHSYEVLSLAVGIVFGPLCFYRDHPLQRLDLKFYHRLVFASFPPFLRSGGVGKLIVFEVARPTRVIAWISLAACIIVSVWLEMAQEDCATQPSDMVVVPVPFNLVFFCETISRVVKVFQQEWKRRLAKFKQPLKGRRNAVLGLFVIAWRIGRIPKIGNQGRLIRRGKLFNKLFNRFRFAEPRPWLRPSTNGKRLLPLA